MNNDILKPEGEALFLEAVRRVRAHYPTELFPEGNENSDRIAASMARRTCDNIVEEYNALRGVPRRVWPPQIHELKTWPQYFDAILGGEKTFEIRENDRGFRVGDTVVLQEWDPKTERYTGCGVRKKITYMVEGGQFGVCDGYCVFGVA